MIVADLQLAEQPQAAQPAGKGDGAPPPRADPAIAKLQVMLDRAGASPGVIDGFFGDNVRKAIAAAETMRGLPADGVVTPALLAQISQPGPVMASYTITQDDAARIGPPVPTDYAEMAKRQSLGYSSIAEELAERFHMDQDLLKALNPGSAFAPGETISVDNPGANVTAQVVRIQADKAQAQVRAYDAAGRMVAAYPATIGSADNPSPSGQHVVEAVVHNPTYTYNPKINFKQGDNDKVLTIPAGPNGPVGSIWIDLSEPTYGIHGTPDPDHISKTNSHGCVRLTNWDAEELAGMVKKGTEVDFVS
jgi:lipoprotein-anchoring transpeptidase ErfK/SrfK